MKVIIECHDESCTLQFTNAKTAELFYNQVKSQAVFMGKWLKQIRIEPLKARRHADNDSE